MCKCMCIYIYIYTHTHTYTRADFSERADFGEAPGPYVPRQGAPSAGSALNKLSYFGCRISCLVSYVCIYIYMYIIMYYHVCFPLNYFNGQLS